LKKNLTLFDKSLASNLADLAAAFPGVPVLLTNYYNPMPLPVTSSNAVCSLTGPVALAIVLQASIPLSDKLAVLSAAIPGTPHHQDFLNGEVLIQNALYTRGATAVGALNSSINNAARSAKNKVTPVPLNFSGHDMCQNGTTTWVFGPNLHVSVTWTPALLPSQTVSLGFGPFPSVCPYIDTNLDMTHDKTIPFGPITGRSLGIWHDLLSTNCMPHPTAAGQQAIANALYPFSPHT
jgi:hypothetical protein